MAADARPSHRLVTVMAGYARDNRLSSVTQRWIDALRRVSTQLVLIFDQDHVEGLEKFSPSDSGVVCLFERHGAYDFGSYQRGLRFAREQQWLDQATHVLLCNDSVVGPFSDLEVILDGMQKQLVPVWGLTDCPLYVPHLQSYFLLLDQDVAQHPGVVNFFESIVPQPSRHDVIQAYELGFSSLLGALGVEWRAWLPTAGMEDPHNGEPILNSMAYPLCSLKGGSPVLKHRALKEVAANQDDLGRTCRCRRASSPDLGRALGVKCSPRLGKSTRPSLRQTDLVCLEERIAWIKAHPHPNLKALGGVLSRHHDTISAEPRLQNGAGGWGAPVSDLRAVRRFTDLAAVVGICWLSWVVVSSPALWSDLAGLQLQLRRLAATAGASVGRDTGTSPPRRLLQCRWSEGSLEEWADG